MWRMLNRRHVLFPRPCTAGLLEALVGATAFRTGPVLLPVLLAAAPLSAVAAVQSPCANSPGWDADLWKTNLLLAALGLPWPKWAALTGMLPPGTVAAAPSLTFIMLGLKGLAVLEALPLLAGRLRRLRCCCCGGLLSGGTGAGLRSRLKRRRNTSSLMS